MYPRPVICLSGETSQEMIELIHQAEGVGHCAGESYDYAVVVQPAEFERIALDYG